MDAGRTSRVSQRIYKATLQVYPREFREEYGPHMEQVFGDLCERAWHRGGVWALGKLWFGTLVDLYITAALERSIVARREPDLAGILSFFVPGLGQLYNRHILKGSLLILATALWMFMFLGDPARFGLEDAPVLLFSTWLVLAAMQIWSIKDAYCVAKQTDAARNG